MFTTLLGRVVEGFNHYVQHVQLHDGAASLMGVLLISVFLVICKVRTGFKEVICCVLYAVSSLAVLFHATEPLFLAIGFDIMALAAMCLLAVGGSSGSKAFLTYACVHFFAGALMLVGACQFLHLGHFEGVPRALFMFGLMANAAAFPLASWVPCSYPKASRSGTIILSMFTTKIAIYTLLRMFSSELLVLIAGIVTVIYGAIFAAMEKNIKRVMSYGVVGYSGMFLMLVGCGIPDDVIVAQMALSVLYQTLLFMVVDSTVENSGGHDTDKLRCEVLSLDAVCCMIALLNMCAFPGTAGYMLKFSILHMDIQGLSYSLLRKAYPICGLLLFMSVGLKFFWCSMLRRTSVNCKGKGRSFPTVLLGLMVMLLSIPSVWNGVFTGYSFVSTSNMGSQFLVLVSCIMCFFVFSNGFLGKYEFTVGDSFLYRKFVSVISVIYYYATCIRNVFSEPSRDYEGMGTSYGYAPFAYSRSEEGIVGSTLLLSMLFICVVLVVWIYV